MDNSAADNQKIVTLLVPAPLFQAGKGKTINVDRRGTPFYPNYDYRHICTVFAKCNNVDEREHNRARRRSQGWRSLPRGGLTEDRIG